VYEIWDLYGKKIRFTKATNLWYFNYDTQKTVNFTRSAGTEYYIYSHATDRSTGKPILLLYPMGFSFLDNATSNILYPGIYQAAIQTFYTPNENLDQTLLFTQGVKTLAEKKKQIEEEEKKAKWYDRLIKGALTAVGVYVGGKLLIDAYSAKKSK